VTIRRAQSLLFLVLLLAAAGARAGDVALAPFVGFQYGGGFDSAFGRASIDIGLQYGAVLDVPIGGDRWGAEVLFARQETELSGVPSRDVAVERYMAGVREEKEVGDRFRFRGVFLVGATRFVLAGLGSDVRFTGAIGLGMRMRLGQSFGLRADVRGYYAVVSLSGGSACVDGSCLFLFGGSGVWQGDVTAGLELRF
jgi:hypothetical protein